MRVKLLSRPLAAKSADHSQYKGSQVLVVDRLGFEVTNHPRFGSFRGAFVAFAALGFLV